MVSQGLNHRALIIGTYVFDCPRNFFCGELIFRWPITAVISSIRGGALGCK